MPSVVVFFAMLAVPDTEMKKIDKSGLCLDEYSTNKNIANIYFKRAIGKLPEMETAKALTKILKKKILKNDQILDVSCASSHYIVK